MLVRGLLFSSLIIAGCSKPEPSPVSAAAEPLVATAIDHPFVTDISGLRDAIKRAGFEADIRTEPDEGEWFTDVYDPAGVTLRTWRKGERITWLQLEFSMLRGKPEADAYGVRHGGYLLKLLDPVAVMPYDDGAAAFRAMVAQASALEDARRHVNEMGLGSQYWVTWGYGRDARDDVRMRVDAAKGWLEKGRQPAPGE